jgi:hypothetical protein
MITKLPMLAVFAMVALPVTASAETITLRKLYDECSVAEGVTAAQAGSNSDMTKAMACLGYVRGFADGLNTLPGSDKWLKWHLNTGTGVLVSAFLDYIHLNLDVLKNSGDDDPRLAMIAAWEQAGIVTKCDGHGNAVK